MSLTGFQSHCSPLTRASLVYLIFCWSRKFMDETEQIKLTCSFTFLLFSLPFGRGMGTEAPFWTFHLMLRAWL